MIDINDPKIRIVPKTFCLLPSNTSLNFYSAMRLARENHITIEFHPKSVCATKQRHSSVIKYAYCKSEDEAAILAVQDCLDHFNRIARAH